MAFVIDRSLYLSPEVVGEPRRCAPLEVKEDPFSLEALVAWLEKQDGATTYLYADWRTCLLGQYTLGVGGKFTSQYGGNYQIGDVVFPALGSDLATEVARPLPQTFGAALSRARKLLAEREK